MPRDGQFGIVGVNAGLAWSENPCLAAQYQWAASLANPASFYVNTANPGPQSVRWNFSGPRSCPTNAPASDAGCAYNYGWNAAQDAYRVAAAATSSGIAQSHFWWLDVELVNSWEGTPASNSQTVQGYLDYLGGRGVAGVGIYSTASQWNAITGGQQVSVPNWVAGSRTQKSASSSCGTGFTGGDVLLVQYTAKGFDGNFACGATLISGPGKNR